MPAIQHDGKRSWEERAATKGRTLSGVLYRGFSEPLNRYVHDWHVAAVVDQLLPLLPRGGLVLDLGCGYGRIRAPVAAARPDLRIVGMDFSQNYCRMYAATQKAATVCADVNRMPFAHEVFDGIIGVTCLMYIERARRAERIPQILEVLKPGGHALFIDPGLEFMRLARLGLRSTRETPTGGIGFLLREYRKLDAGPQHRVHALGAMPAFTAMLPALYATTKNATVTRYLLRVAQRLDFGTRAFGRLSLQRWALIGPR